MEARNHTDDVNFPLERLNKRSSWKEVLGFPRKSAAVNMKTKKITVNL